MKLSETELLHQLILRAPAVLPDVRVFRRNVGLFRSLEGKRAIYIGVEGQCDAYALLRGGRHIEIEAKAAKGTLANAQKAWRAWCERWDVPYLVIRARRDETPDETVNRWIDELRAVVESCK